MNIFVYVTIIFNDKGKIPVIDGYVPPSIYANKTSLLSSPNHDWTRRLRAGPLDLGFQQSFVSDSGIQAPPYIFLYNSKIRENDLNNITFWREGNHSMPEGISMINSGKGGDGAIDWDSTAYNMILVNATKRFIDYHTSRRPDDPFFTYVALGTVHIPHSPPYKYLDDSPIAGQYDTPHKDLLGEMDKVVGSLLQILEDKQLIEDTIIVFTSDNGGLHSQYSDFSSGPLRSSKGSIYEGGHRIPMILRWDNGNITRKGEMGKMCVRVL